MEKMLRTRRKRRSTSSNPEKIMELMIVGDKNAVLYHGKEFLYTYLLSIGNIVSTSLIYVWSSPIPTVQCLQYGHGRRENLWLEGVRFNLPEFTWLVG